jgi:hypothetical protein
MTLELLSSEFPDDSIMEEITLPPSLDKSQREGIIKIKDEIQRNFSYDSSQIRSLDSKGRVDEGPRYRSIQELESEGKGICRDLAIWSVLRNRESLGDKVLSFNPLVERVDEGVYREGIGHIFHLFSIEGNLGGLSISRIKELSFIETRARTIEEFFYSEELRRAYSNLFANCRDVDFCGFTYLYGSLEALFINYEHGIAQERSPGVIYGNREVGFGQIIF